MKASIFYEQKYLDIQSHLNYVQHDSDDFMIGFSVKGGTAFSLPQGLFGSVLLKNRKASFEDFLKFWEKVKQDLIKIKVNRIELVHPIDIYKGYIKEAWLEEVGFGLMHQDINHHIDLRNHKLHKMEERKLKKMVERNYNFSPVNRNHFGTVYDFLAKCRSEKGLVLNINKFKLGRLFMTFPNQYHLFTGTLENEMACATITMAATSNVAYYFLPGTLEAYKKDSPMVGLLHIIVDQLKGKYRYLDLGISSLEGKPQEGLVSFKERMGGIHSFKNRYYMKL